MNIMFSIEMAKAQVCDIDNPFHTRDNTLTNATKTGIINTFGINGHSCGGFIVFLKKYNVVYNTNHYAIFQYNCFRRHGVNNHRKRRLDENFTI